MKTRSKVKRRLSELQACSFGVLGAMLIMVSLVIISTIFINNEYFDLKMYSAVATPIQFVSCLLGCLIAGECASGTGYRATIIAGAVFVALRLCIAMIFAETISATIWLDLLASAGAIACGILACKAKENKGKTRTRGRRHK